MAQFAVVFPAYSYPITSNHFVQVDHTHWVLDICSLVRQQYWEVKEVSSWPGDSSNSSKRRRRTRTTTHVEGVLSADSVKLVQVLPAVFPAAELSACTIALEGVKGFLVIHTKKCGCK
jgi:hypothetical protein